MAPASAFPSDFKWTDEDNRIAEVELQMATILTEELNTRPCVSLHLLFMSQRVQAKIQPPLKVLEHQLGRLLKADCTSHIQPDRTRKVVVVISNL